MIIIDILLNIIMITDTIRKDTSMIINIWIKEKVVTKEYLLIFQGINIRIDRKKVEAEVEIVEVGVEVGEEEVAIVDIGIENIQILILFENLMIIMNSSCFLETVFFNF